MKHASPDTLRSFAHLDHDRHRRTGIPEAVYAESKTVDQVVRSLNAFAAASGFGIATRVVPAHAKSIVAGIEKKFATVWYEASRLIVVIDPSKPRPKTGGKVAVFAAGTSDLSVAEEARVTAETMGCTVYTYYDVGIAGIHRLVHPVEQTLAEEVSVAVVVAGMEGALPSVVRGLLPIPVIGVPTSIGYGYGGRGEGALMTMLQSCAPGLTVVNVDNGFGAGATAALIANIVAGAGVRPGTPIKNNSRGKRRTKGTAR